jgi:hypothetical protein
MENRKSRGLTAHLLFCCNYRDPVGKGYTALVTVPERRQRVQTFMDCTLPL